MPSSAAYLAPALITALAFAAITARGLYEHRQPHQARTRITTRTYRAVQHRIDDHLDRGEYAQARFLMEQLCAWLTDRIRHGPAAARIARAAALEQWELRWEQTAKHHPSQY